MAWFLGVFVGLWLLFAVIDALLDRRARRRIPELLSDGQWWKGLDMVERGKLSRWGLYATLHQMEADGLLVSKPLEEPPHLAAALAPFKRRLYRLASMPEPSAP